MLIANRMLVGSLIGSSAFRRRVLVLGAGERAQRLKRLGERPESGFVVVGYVAMNEGPAVVEEAIPRSAIHDLRRFVENLGASEVVLALEERRNALPLKDLLRIKTAGVHVNDFSSFMERETGRVDLDTLNPSWLIFSDGFSSGGCSRAWPSGCSTSCASGLLLALTFPLIALFALLVKLDSKGPAFFRQTRVGLYGEPFTVLKLRSMRTDAEKDGAKWAEKDDPRVTRLGRFIRKVRIDELPQAWTVLTGRMSFVGPRPEVPQFVDRPRGQAALLRRAAHGEAGHHRLGADQLSLWRQRRGCAAQARIRSLLRQELHAFPRPADPAPDAARGAVARGRAVSVQAAFWLALGNRRCTSSGQLSARWSLRGCSAAATRPGPSAPRWPVHSRSHLRGVLPTPPGARAVRSPTCSKPRATCSVILVLYRLFATDGRDHSLAPIRPLVLVLAFVECLQPAVEMLDARFAVASGAHEVAFAVSALLRALVAVGALVLLHNLYAGASAPARQLLRWPAAALAGFWAYDLNLYTDRLDRRRAVDRAGRVARVGLRDRRLAVRGERQRARGGPSRCRRAARSRSSRSRCW